MEHKKLSFLIIITLTFACLGLILTAYAAINVNTTINSSGSILSSLATSSELGIYSDSSCTVPLTALDWGSLSPGGTVSKTIYIKNTQGSVLLKLSLATTDWNPTTANGPLTVTWNKQGTTLSPGQTTAATINLSASSTITGITNFGVQISINGTG